MSFAVYDFLLGLGGELKKELHSLNSLMLDLGDDQGQFKDGMADLKNYVQTLTNAFQRPVNWP